jgi:7-cyano-7-deazaguanine synthase in queuosine biosynthesis
MSKRTTPVDLVATMRLPRDPEKTLSLDLADLKWRAHGLEGIGRADPAMLDLLEIARVVHEFDRRQPKRTTGVRVKQVRVTMPLRVPDRWTAGAKAELCALLRIQGNAEWIFDFKKRSPGKSGADLLFEDGVQTGRKFKKTGERTPSARAVQAVALFSGGLDSTSGLATLARQADTTLLVAYYAQNRTKQLHIAKKLGFERLVQIKSEWAVPKSAGRVGGQFMYRSFLFLSLAALLANATRAPCLLQFENGPLALAVQPLDLYRITRHAHPLVHLHLANLFKRLTGRTLAVSNPFLSKTKGEAITLLKRHLSEADFKEVVGETESCWYLNSTTIIAGRFRKKNGQACGACVPCLVRRAALGADDTKAAVDFKNGNGRAERNRVVRVHYEAYSGFAERLLGTGYGLHDFMEEVPAVTRTALSRATLMDPDTAFDLYRRFAREWIKAFA